MHRLSLILATLVLPLAAEPSFAQEATTQPANAPASTQESAVPPEVLTWPKREVKSLTELFKLSVREGYLSLDTDEKASDGPVLIKSPGLPKGGVLKVTPQGAGNQLQLFEFTTPAPGGNDPDSNLTISALVNRVHISYTVAVGEAANSTELIQQIYDPAESDEPAIRLHITVVNPVNGETLIRKSLEGTSFDDLRLRYPREVSQYVVPMLAMLEQDSAVLAPDAKLAKQVLRDEETPDADVTAKVKTLVADLASEDTKKRDDAYATLEKLGEPGVAAIDKIDRTTLSADQNSLIDQLLSSRLPAAPDEARQLATKPLFLLDCLYLSDASQRQAAIDKLAKLTSMKFEFDANAAEPARRQQILKIRSQVTQWASSQPAAKVY